MLSALRKKFYRDESGSAGLELMFMTPAVFMLFAGTITFFDAYRAKFEAQAATITIGDMVSRETTALDDEYLDGLLGIFDSLAYRSEQEQMRVTVINYNETNDLYSVAWSQGRGTAMTPLDDANLEELRKQIPLLADEERIVFIETRTEYIVPVPIVAKNVLQDFTIDNSIMILPRFGTTVCFEVTPESVPLC